MFRALQILRGQADVSVVDEIVREEACHLDLSELDTVCHRHCRILLLANVGQLIK